MKKLTAFLCPTCRKRYDKFTKTTIVAPDGTYTEFKYKPCGHKVTFDLKKGVIVDGD